eukprot:TRINITY_DN2457_c0_g1_i2.p1 TRINITY_DN2457_c0_g1~~TRINITY_DN2457_c0_g1_i2.p1  ORF type:complete len:439 (-),score=97.87 TRINITY_DN2457_c0_g1_i2:624-1940(-)
MPRRSVDDLILDFGVSTSVFNVPLASTINRESNLYNIPDLKIPLTLDVILSHLENIDKEIEGEILIDADVANTKVIAIAEQFDEGNFHISRGEEPSVLCGLLKMYLQNLPEPLVPISEYKTFIDQARQVKKRGADKICLEMKMLLRIQPDVNIISSQRVLLFLSKMIGSWWTDNSQAEIIAKEFAPYFLRPKLGTVDEVEITPKDTKKIINTFKFLVEHVLSIYGKYDDEGRHDIYLSISHPKLLSTPRDTANPEDTKTLHDLFNSRKAGKRTVSKSKLFDAPDTVVQQWKQRVRILRKEMTRLKEIREKTEQFITDAGLKGEYIDFMAHHFPDEVFGEDIHPVEEKKIDVDFKEKNHNHDKNHHNEKNHGKKIRAVKESESSDSEVLKKPRRTRKSSTGTGTRTLARKPTEESTDSLRSRKRKKRPNPTVFSDSESS